MVNGHVLRLLVARDHTIGGTIDMDEFYVGGNRRRLWLIMATKGFETFCHINRINSLRVSKSRRKIGHADRLCPRVHR